MYCHECGTPLPSTAAYCPQCGSPVRPPSHQPSAPAAPAASSVANPAVAAPAGEGPTLEHRRKGRRGGITLALALLMIGLAFLFEVLGVFVGYALPVDVDLVTTLFGAVGGVLGMVALGGGGTLVPRREALALSWRTGWWVIAVSVALFLYDIISTIAVGEFVPVDDWPVRVLNSFVLCVGIGVFEETVFRGLLLGGMLDAFGTTRRGVTIAVVVGALLFGMAHVSWGELNYADPLDLAQALLKTVQTGTYGFFLAALVVRTGNLVGPIILHALDDFVLLVTSVGLLGESSEVEYVSSGEDAWPTIVLYVIIIVLYIPLVVQGVRLLRQSAGPERGALHKEG